MTQKLIIVRGAACSGKTTICKEIRDFDKKIAWLSIDKVKNIFSDFKDEALDDVNQSAVVTLKDLLTRGYSVVVDGIFKNPGHIEEIVKVGKEKNIPVVIYQLECSLKTLKERDKSREGVAQGLWKPLGDEIIESLYRKVEENPIKGAIKLNTEQTPIQESIKTIRRNFEKYSGL